MDSSNRMYCNNVIDTDNDSMADPTRKVLVFGTRRSLLSSALRAAPPSNTETSLLMKATESKG